MRALAIAVALGLAPSVAFAAGFYLILIPSSTSRTSILVPTAYETQQDCRRAGRPWVNDTSGNRFVCIPAR